MSDIRRLADRIVCLRDGGITGVFDAKPLDYEGAVNAMLGQKVDLGQVVVRDADRTVFAATDLRIAPGAAPFSMELGDGEIVAVTGLVGVGKTALAETLFGHRQPHRRRDDAARQALCAAIDRRGDRRRRLPRRQGPGRRAASFRTSTSTRT